VGAVGESSSAVARADALQGAIATIHDGKVSVEITLEDGCSGHVIERLQPPGVPDCSGGGIQRRRERCRDVQSRDERVRDPGPPRTRALSVVGEPQLVEKITAALFVPRPGRK